MGIADIKSKNKSMQSSEKFGVPVEERCITGILLSALPSGSRENNIII